MPFSRFTSDRRPVVRRAATASWWRGSLCSAVALLTTAAQLRAGAASFAEMSLEELLNEPVTSVARKESTVFASPAAISVISGEDIERTGHTSLPELLRLVPGLQVARINGNEWALTARGFNDQYANKLLVLVDGRTVYSPMFAGVYWNAQDTILADVDRIEVIRGPGATLWGANAVNGVINITSKSARDTQGGLVTTEVGTEERPSVSVRYGGELGRNVFYRAYAKFFDREGFLDQPGQSGADSWQSARVGTRIDWEPATDRDLLTFQAEYNRASVGEHFEGTSLLPPFGTAQNLIHRNFGGHVLGRWTRTFSPESQWTVQAFYDRFHHGDGDTAETRDTLDFDVQHRFSVGTRQDLVWGFGYRWTTDRLTPSFYLSFDPERETEVFENVFVQDEIALVPDRLAVTVGAKVEHNQATHTETQPSARLRWTPTDRQSLWASVSRAVRIPSRYDRHARLNAAVFPAGANPMLVSLLSRDDARSERLTAYEAGYRIEPSARFSLELATFYNRYDRVLTYLAEPVRFEAEPAPGHLLLPLMFDNALSGTTYGTELSARWRVTPGWKLIASHSWLHMRMTPEESKEVESPQHQFQLRSNIDLARHIRLTAAAYYVGTVSPSLDNERVHLPARIRGDLGVSWQPSDALELGVWGQNLLDPRHAEFGSFKTTTLAEVPRSLVTRITWRF